MNKREFDEDWMGALVGARPATVTELPVERDLEGDEVDAEPEGPKLPDLRALYPAPDAACSREQFLKDVATHQMTVLKDDGVYRHLRFKRHGTSQCWFQLTTWPGYLAITGDMGDFVFTRTHDMFAFFRPDDWEKLKGEPYINPGYWSEKCVSRDRGGMDKFEPETFKAKIADWCADDEDLTPELWEEIKSEVMSKADDGSDAAYRAALDFRIEVKKGPGHSRYRDYFQDFWEVDCTEWTYGYLWCLYAIVWGIHQYDVERMRKAGLWHNVAKRRLVNAVKAFVPKREGGK